MSTKENLTSLIAELEGMEADPLWADMKDSLGEQIAENKAKLKKGVFEKERPYTGPTYAECMNLGTFPKLKAEFVCPRCGPKKFFHFSVFDQMATIDHSGGEDEARSFFSHTINDSLQTSIAGEGLDEIQHRLYCDELTRRVEAGAVLDTMETIELRHERAQAQAWQRLWDRKHPSVSSGLSESDQKRNAEIIARQEKNWCKGCHFPPALCGCLEGYTLHAKDDVYMEKRDKEQRMQAVKCLRCDNVFAACKCTKLTKWFEARRKPVAPVKPQPRPQAESVSRPYPLVGGGESINPFLAAGILGSGFGGFDSGGGGDFD